MILQETDLAILILCGGQSSRMGDPKYKICYHGMPQWAYLYTIGDNMKIKAFVSCNDQQEKEFPPHILKIIDSVSAKGPAVGLLSAHQQFPQYSFIVLACDIPLINEKTISTLIAQRDTTYIATAYRNQINNLPEPLIALWEVQGLERLQLQADMHVFCPRKILTQQLTKLIVPNFDMELFNANTPEDYQTIQSYIAHSYTAI